MGLFHWVKRQTRRVISDIGYYSIDVPVYYCSAGISSSIGLLHSYNKAVLSITTYWSLACMMIYAYFTLLIVWCYLKFYMN